MNPSQIENWALSIVDRVKKKQPVEDNRVGLKSNWIDPYDAARRIAGHSNSAGGEPILWLIGVDERAGTIIGADKNEMANWWPSVRAYFNDLVPSVIDLNIPSDGITVVALLFDTNRAPFLVKNPIFGKPNGGSVSLEVPWREGTATRSATRSDLIRLLVPLGQMPTVEVLTGYLRANIVAQGSLGWYLEMQTLHSCGLPTPNRFSVSQVQCLGWYS
jgi:hypothetical protein